MAPEAQEDGVKVDRGQPDDRNMAKVVGRIQKLLALEGRDEKEAEAYAAEAHRLMLKYNLDMAQVVAAGGPSDAEMQERVKEKQDPGRALFKWQRELAAACADAYFCYHSITNTYELRGSDDETGDETPAKRRMRELRDEGLSLRRIGEALEEEGFLTPKGGTKWASSSVQAILNERRRTKVPTHTFIGRRVNVIQARKMFDYLSAVAQRLCPYAGFTNSGYSWKAGFSDRLQARLYDRKRAMIAEYEAKQQAAREAHQKRVEEHRRRKQEAFERQRELKLLRERQPTPGEVAGALGATARDATRKAAECADHWHCDPEVAAHECSAPDRARPCPTCGVDRPAPAEGDDWSPGDGADAAGDVDMTDLEGIDLEEPTAMVLASQYDDDEWERNYEMARGLEPGELARRRAAREAEQRDLAEKRARGEIPEEPEPEPGKPETPGQKRRREERERRAAERRARRDELARHRVWASRDRDAYWAGERSARDVGLDEQVAEGRKAPQLEAGGDK